MGDSDKSEPHELFGRRGNKIIADRDEEITDHKEDIADRKEKEPVEAEKWNILGRYGIARTMEDSQNHDAPTGKIANTRIETRRYSEIHDTGANAKSELSFHGQHRKGRRKETQGVRT